MLQANFAAALPPETRARLADRGIIVVADHAPKPHTWFQAEDAAAVLVRPDRYVLGAARSLQELDALVAVV